MRRFFLGMLGAFALIAAAGAQDDSQLGKSEFMRSCASCHGVDGKGNGPVARTLKNPPADLTKLSEHNKGIFPISRVYGVIDGRVQVIVHGPRQMPVWGDIYTQAIKERAPRDFMSSELNDILVRVRILTLVEYISSIQAK